MKKESEKDRHWGKREKMRARLRRGEEVRDSLGEERTGAEGKGESKKTRVLRKTPEDINKDQWSPIRQLRLVRRA